MRGGVSGLSGATPPLVSQAGPELSASCREPAESDPGGCYCGPRWEPVVTWGRRTGQQLPRSPRECEPGSSGPRQSAARARAAPPGAWFDRRCRSRWRRGRHSVVTGVAPGPRAGKEDRKAPELEGKAAPRPSAGLPAGSSAGSGLGSCTGPGALSRAAVLAGSRRRPFPCTGCHAACRFTIPTPSYDAGHVNTGSETQTAGWSVLVSSVSLQKRGLCAAWPGLNLTTGVKSLVPHASQYIAGPGASPRAGRDSTQPLRGLRPRSCSRPLHRSPAIAARCLRSRR